MSYEELLEGLKKTARKRGGIVMTIPQLAASLGVTPCWLAFGCEHKTGQTGHDK